MAQQKDKAELVTDTQTQKYKWLEFTGEFKCRVEMADERETRKIYAI